MAVPSPVGDVEIVSSISTFNSVFCATSKSAEEAKPLDPPPTEGKDQEKSVCLTKTSPFYVTVIFPVVN